MTNKAFHLRYIDPYYMSLMNLNFVYKSKVETEILLGSLKEKGKELSDEILIRMLNDVWRPSKISAWIIGISNRDNLTSELIKALNKSGKQYYEHILLNVLILDNQNGECFMKFINQQMDYFIETNNILIVDNLSIDWTISILHYLDIKNKSSYIETLKSSEKWIEFDQKISLIKYADGIKESFVKGYYLEEITLMMERINHC